MSVPEKSFVVELNEAARRCSDTEWRVALLLAATRLHHALTELGKLPNQANMQEVNSAWVRAFVMLRDLPPEAEPDPPFSGDAFPARFAAAA